MSAVVASALRLVAVGAVAGAVAAIATGRVVTSLLYNVSPADWIALSGAAVATLTAALVASLIPAAQASRVDPDRRAARRGKTIALFPGFWEADVTEVRRFRHLEAGRNEFGVPRDDQQRRQARRHVIDPANPKLAQIEFVEVAVDRPPR